MYLVFYKYGEDLKPHLLGAYNSYKIIPVEVDIDSEDNPGKDRKELVWEGI